MDKELIEQINRILDKKEIDERAKSFIKLYFLGKVKVGEMTSEKLEPQIDALCSRINSVEFSSNNIVAAYSDKSGVLTVNKQLLLDGKSDQVILPVFTKFEGILNQNNRNNYANYIEDFIRAGRIAKSTSLPISDELYKLYEMAEYSYGDIEHKTDELIQDSSWQATCSKYNNAINHMVVTGQANQKELLNGANLFHYEVFTGEALQNPNFEGPFKIEEYQKKAARILEFVEGIDPEVNPTERASLARNIRLFTGCNREMVEESKIATYIGDSRISAILQSEVQTHMPKISEEVIVSKVQSMLDRKPEWDSRIKHLVIPFFIRSQKIYSWDIDEFNERLNQIDLKIDKIGFEDLGNITTMGDTAMDKIRLNSRIFFDRKRKTIMACYQNIIS